MCVCVCAPPPPSLKFLIPPPPPPQHRLCPFTLKLADLGLSRSVSAENEYYRHTSNDAVPVKWMCPTVRWLEQLELSSSHRLVP